LQAVLTEQAWSMYLYPYPENYRLQVSVPTARGERVIGLGACREGWPALEEFAPAERLWANYRTRMYLYDGIADPTRRREWEAFAAWFQRRWDAAHPAQEERLNGPLEVRKEVRRSWRPGEQPAPVQEPVRVDLLYRP
jgi:hypothetical protein